MKLNRRKISTIALATILMSGNLTNIFAENMVDKDRTLVISPGEYPNKPGKRSSVASEVSYDKNKYPTYKDGTLGEHYINKPFVEKISEYVTAKDNSIKVVEYYRQGKNDDLNAMGKIAKDNGGDMYLSIHTNYHDSKSKSGFIAMTSKYDEKYKKESDELAKKFANSLNDNQIPIKPDRKNGLSLEETKIGELNKSMQHMPSVLIELGYYSNPDELSILTNSTYINTISNRIAEVIVDEFNTGKYDNDQDSEKVIPTTKKKEEKIENVKEETEQTIEPPTPEEDGAEIKEDEIYELKDEAEIESEVIDNAEVNTTSSTSKGILSLFNKEEKVKETKKEDDKKSLEEMTLEEVEAEYQRALKELRTLRDEL